MLIYVIDGPDGVGKTTLCKNLAFRVSETYPELVGVHVGLPNNSVAQIRTMFIDGTAFKASFSESGATCLWETPTYMYGAAEPLLVLANLSHTYAALTELEDTLEPDKELVVFLDREILSTIAYQFVNKSKTGPTSNQMYATEFLDICDVVLHPIGIKSGLIILYSSKENPPKHAAADRFETGDQMYINEFFKDITYAAKYRDGDPLGAWMNKNHEQVLWFESFKYTHEELLDTVMDRLDPLI